MKPHIRLADLPKTRIPVADRPMSEAVKKAKERHGRKFSWEEGSDWKPHPVHLLTQWLQTRVKP